MSREQFLHLLHTLPLDVNDIKSNIDASLQYTDGLIVKEFVAGHYCVESEFKKIFFRFINGFTKFTNF